MFNNSSGRSSVSTDPAYRAYDGPADPSVGASARSVSTSTRAPSTTRSPQVVAVKQIKAAMPRNVDLWGDAWQLATEGVSYELFSNTLLLEHPASISQGKHDHCIHHVCLLRSQLQGYVSARLPLTSAQPTCYQLLSLLVCRSITQHFYTY